MLTPSEEHDHNIERRHSLVMKKQRKKYTLNHSQLVKREHRLVSWHIVADRVERHFSAAENSSRAHEWFEHLYSYRDDDRRTVQLFFGSHPIPSTGSKDTERGASLVVSQNVLGGVIVLFYPFETDSVQRIKSRVIWGVLDGPEDLSDGLLLRMLDEFLTYSRVSSILFSSSRLDERRAFWLERNSRLLEGSSGGVRLWAATIATLVVGSLATACIYIAWALDQSRGWLEPYAGLVGLLTAWVAVRVQSGHNAIDKAMAKEEAEKADRAHQQKHDSSE